MPKLLISEESSGSAEDEMMWFSLKYEKMDEPAEEQDPEDADEKWRTKWLQHMEQRE